VNARPLTNTPPNLEHVGVHYEDDLIVFRIRGPLDGSVARYVGALQDQLALQVGYALELQDCSQITTFTAEARRSFFEWNRKRQYPGAVAIVGASFVLKTMAMMLFRAVKLIVTVAAEMEFFDTEAEARAWLDAQRALMKKALAKV
jgi:hypothetical protein